MADLEKVLKAVADGLRSMADAMRGISEQVDDLIQNRLTKAERPEPVKDRSRVEKPVRKTAPLKEKKTPAEVVLGLIRKSIAPISNTVISKQTGLDARQVSNAIYRLKKQGKIAVVGRGTYSAI